MNGETIEEAGVIRQLRALYEGGGGIVDKRRYQQDSDRMQLRIGILESRIVALLEAVGDQGVVTAASRFPWVPMSTTAFSFLTGVSYDAASGILSQTSRTARILGVGDPSDESSGTVSKTSIDFVTDVDYDTGTGVLSQTKRSATIFSFGDAVPSTIETAEDCPT